MEIPIGSSSNIFYDGLPNLPKFGNILVAHTTVYDGGFMNEDNRLCAVDIVKGETKWFFPDDIDQRHYCHFDSNGYLFENKLVFQYGKDARSYSAQYHNTTVCLDITTGKTLWEIDGMIGRETVRSSKGVVGKDGYCYFVQDSCMIYRANLANGTIDELYDTKPLQIDGLKYCDDCLVLSCRMPNRVCAIIIDLQSESIKNIELGSDSNCPPRGYLKDHILYAGIDAFFTAIDVKKDAKLWERNDLWAHTPVDVYVYKDILLKCAGNATVGYNKNTGEILYEYRDYGSLFTSVHGKYAYLLNAKGIIDVLDIESGQKLDVIKCPYGPDGFSGPYPTIHDNKLYIMGANRLFRYPTYPWK